MDNISEKIRKLFLKVLKVESLYDKEGRKAIEKNVSVLSSYLNIIFGVSFDKEEVIDHWVNLFRIKEEFEKKLLREVDIRVVILEYFLNDVKVLVNPKILEMKIFEKLIGLSYRDFKTGLYNFLFFKNSVLREVKISQEIRKNFSILLIDLDNFKPINDQFGHKFGDRLLVDFGYVLKSCCREYDVPCRYGGDEFAVLMPLTGRIGARVLAEKIREKTFEFFAEKSLNITTSIGISTFPMDGESFEELIEKADKFLYFSKKRGRDTVTDIFDYTDEDERRFYPRFRLENQNIYVLVSSGNRVFDARVLDISKNGVSLAFYDRGIHLDNSELRVMSFVLNGTEYPVDGKISIVRTDKHGGEYVFGCTTVNPSLLETMIYLFDKEKALLDRK